MHGLSSCFESLTVRATPSLCYDSHANENHHANNALHLHDGDCLVKHQLVFGPSRRYFAPFVILPTYLKNRVVSKLNFILMDTRWKKLKSNLKKERSFSLHAPVLVAGCNVMRHQDTGPRQIRLLNTPCRRDTDLHFH